MTHPAKDLLIAIAEGKQQTQRNTLYPNAENWVHCSVEDALRAIAAGFYEAIRIARPMVTRTVTYPEPLRVKPEEGVMYWYYGPNHSKPLSALWEGGHLDHRIFAAGMAFATEADAAEAHRALYGAQT